MVGRKKGFSAKQSKRMSRRMSDSTVGTHVERGAHGRHASNAHSVSFSSSRASSRASRSQVSAMAPLSTSGENQAAYERRTRKRQYIDAVQHRANIRRIVVGVLAFVFIAAIALGAGFIALRGTVGSEMALKHSNAGDALVAPKSDEAHYTLISAELGAAADPLGHDGPDLLLLARIDPTAHTLALVNIPAGLQISVDNNSYRIASTASQGDAALITAVSNFSKVDIGHFVKLGKDDIPRIVDALGGVEVNLEQVLDDPHAGDAFYLAGAQTLDGNGALTYLRATNSRLGTEDQFKNQVDFAARLLAKLFSSDGVLTTRIESIDSYFQTDMSLSDIESVGSWMKGRSASDITCKVLPGYMTSSTGVVDSGEERYVASSADMAKLIGALEGDESAESAESAPTETVDPSSFTIEVQNGTDITGAGATTADTLTAAGFNVTKTGNAEQQVYEETLVIYNTKPVKNGNEAADTADESEEGQEAQDGATSEDGGENAAQQANSQQSAQAAAESEAAAAAGLARANTVINSLGIGRAVEAGSYYDFKTDVLVIIGYDYKPVV